MRRHGHSHISGVAGLVVAFLTMGTLAAGGEPRLNQLQVIGSHNSYHVAPDGAIRELLVSRNMQRAQALDYTHRPLAKQFATLVRVSHFSAMVRPL